MYPMFDKCSNRARKVFSLADREAQRFNHEYIGTEHILLGLVQEGSGLAARVLKNLDVDLRKIRTEVERVIPSGPPTVPVGQLPFTPRAKHALELAQKESESLGHDHIGTEHLLLGILREHEGIAAQVLMNLGLILGEVRAEVLLVLEAEVEPTTVQAPSRALPSWDSMTLVDLVLALQHDIAAPTPQGPPTLDRMSDEVRGALRSASEIARLAGCCRVEPEHLFAALLQRVPSRAANQLRVIRIDPAQMTIALLNQAPVGASPAAAEPSSSPSVDRSIGRAWELARRAGKSTIALYHALLGLVSEAEGELARFLQTVGVEHVDLRRELVAWLQPDHEPALPPSYASSLPPIPISPQAWDRLHASCEEALRRSHERIGLPHLVTAFLPDATEVNWEEPGPGAATAQAALRFDPVASDAITRVGELAWAMGDDSTTVLHFEVAILSVMLTEWAGHLGEDAAVLTRRRQRAWKKVLALTPAIPDGRTRARAFAGESIASLRRASELSRAEGAPFTEPHHLLLALLEDQAGAASRLLDAMRVDREASRLVVERRPRWPDVKPAEGVRLSPATVDAVAMAAEETFALRLEAIDTDHLLLGLLRTRITLAAQALGCVGMGLLRARVAALELALAR